MKWTSISINSVQRGILAGGYPVRTVWTPAQQKPLSDGRKQRALLCEALKQLTVPQADDPGWMMRLSLTGRANLTRRWKRCYCSWLANSGAINLALERRNMEMTPL
ncbi:uncharacterized protein LOC144208938 [Stigmatopora nigra]